MKVVSVVGSRPQFVKLAPVARALADAGAEHVVMHTGPAYLQAMYADLFERFDLPGVDVHLEIEPPSATGETAEDDFNRRWALSILEGTLDRMREECGDALLPAA